MFGKKKNLAEANDSLLLAVGMMSAIGLDFEQLSARGETALKEEVEKLTAAAKEEGKNEAVAGVESEALAAIGKALGVTDEKADLAAAAAAVVAERGKHKAEAEAKGKKVSAYETALVEAKVFASPEAAAGADAAALKKAFAYRISTAAAEALALHGIEPGKRPEGSVKPDATKPDATVTGREKRAAELREKLGIN